MDELGQRGETLALSPSDAAALHRLRDRLEIDWLGPGAALVKGRGMIGSAIVGQTEIRVNSKVPLANTYLLASLAFDVVLPKPYLDSLATAVEPVASLLALMLSIQVERILDHDFRQGYVTVEDTIGCVRGRIRFGLASTLSRPGLLTCEYDDFVPDTPENRALRCALEVLALGELHAPVRPRLEQCLGRMAGITHVRPASRPFDRCRLTRLNERYRPALDLARIVLESGDLASPAGESIVPSIWFPMDRVFELGIARWLSARIGDVHLQAGHTISSGLETLKYRPDIEVGHAPSLIIDTKYKRPEIDAQFGGKEFRNSDVYQATFYALARSCPAILIYPRTDRDIDVTFTIEGTNVTVATVDLTISGTKALDDLAARVSVAARAGDLADGATDGAG